MIFDPQEKKNWNKTKIRVEWLFFMKTIMPCLHGNPLLNLFIAFPIFSVTASGIQTRCCDIRSLFTPFHSFSQYRLKGEQSPVVYVDLSVFFLMSRSIYISFCPFSTLSSTCLINFFLRPVLHNVMTRTYVRVSLSFLLPACCWEAFSIVPGLLNYTVSPEVNISII